MVKIKIAGISQGTWFIIYGVEVFIVGMVEKKSYE